MSFVGRGGGSLLAFGDLYALFGLVEKIICATRRTTPLRTPGPLKQTMRAHSHLNPSSLSISVTGIENDSEGARLVIHTPLHHACALFALWCVLSAYVQLAIGIRRHHCATLGPKDSGGFTVHKN